MVEGLVDVLVLCVRIVGVEDGVGLGVGGPEGRRGGDGRRVEIRRGTMMWGGVVIGCAVIVIEGGREG